MMSAATRSRVAGGSKWFTLRNIFFAFVFTVFLSTLIIAGLILSDLNASPDFTSSILASVKNVRNHFPDAATFARFKHTATQSEVLKQESFGAIDVKELTTPDTTKVDEDEGDDIEEQDAETVARRGTIGQQEVQRAETCATSTPQLSGHVVDSTGAICLDSNVSEETNCCVSGGDVGVPSRGFMDAAEAPPSFSAADVSQQLTAGSGVLRYVCSSCDEITGCCAAYEVCVSCCMHPSHWGAAEAVGSSRAARIPTDKELRHFALVDILADSGTAIVSQSRQHEQEKQWRRFSYCTYRCRTSSGSVQHENSYRGPQANCYAGYEAPLLWDTVNSDRMHRSYGDLRTGDVMPGPAQSLRHSELQELGAAAAGGGAGRDKGRQDDRRAAASILTRDIYHTVEHAKVAKVRT